MTQPAEGQAAPHLYSCGLQANMATLSGRLDEKNERPPFSALKLTPVKSVEESGREVGSKSDPLRQRQIDAVVLESLSGSWVEVRPIKTDI